MATIGLVGFPNVGKSTLLKACSNKADIEIENRPFSTIDPNISIVPVPDPQLNRIAQIVKPKKVVPTTLKMVDIAGLVSGASKGEGLGNKFLAHIREVDAIIQVVRCFTDADIIHVAGVVNPVSDVETIQTELILSDLETAERALKRNQPALKSNDKTAVTRNILLERIVQQLNHGALIRALDFTLEEKNILNPLQFLTIKPMIYVANVSEDGFQNNPQLTQLENYLNAQNAIIIPVCAKLEAELTELSEEEKIQFLREFNLNETILERIIRVGYELLEQRFFTAGIQEVRAWTTRKGASALDAAGCIHTDFAKGFIRAEVVSYEDFVRYEGWQGAKKYGKVRLEGKDYLIHPGDVIHFLFNV